MAIVTDKTLKFARGTYDSYIEAIPSGFFQDYIYFTTDTKEILMYKDASTWGSYGYRGMIDDIEISTRIDSSASNYKLNLALHYADGSEQVLRSVSLKEIIKTVVNEESFPEFEARLSAVENAVT